ILDSGVHAETAIGRVCMRRVAGEKHATVGKAVSHRPLAHPQDLVLDRVRYVASQAPPDQPMDVCLLQRCSIGADVLQAPQVLSVDGGDERPTALRADEHVAKGFALVVMRGQISNPKISVHGPVNVSLAADGNPEQFPDGALKAIAADEV